MKGAPWYAIVGALSALMALFKSIWGHKHGHRRVEECLGATSYGALPKLRASYIRECPTVGVMPWIGLRVNLAPEKANTYGGFIGRFKVCFGSEADIGTQATSLLLSTSVGFVY